MASTLATVDPCYPLHGCQCADVTIAAVGIPPAVHASTAASPALALPAAQALGGSPERGSPWQEGAQRRGRRANRRSSLQIMSATVVHAFTPPAAVEAASAEAVPGASAGQPAAVAHSPVPRLGAAAGGGLFGFAAAAAFSSPPAAQPLEAAATPGSEAAEGGPLDPASPAALEALATARKPAEPPAAEPEQQQQQQAQQQQQLQQEAEQEAAEEELPQPQPEPEEADATSAGQSACSSGASSEAEEEEEEAAAGEYEAVVEVEAAGGQQAGEQEAETEEQLLEDRQPSDSPLWQGNQRPDLAGPDAEAAGAAAAAEAAAAASPQSASAGQAASPPAGSYSPGPLQGALLQHQGSGVPLPAAAGELQALNRSVSGPFVTARSKLSGEMEGEEAVEGVEEDDENASPSTEPLRWAGTGWCLLRWQGAGHRRLAQHSCSCIPAVWCACQIACCALPAVQCCPLPR